MGELVRLQPAGLDTLRENAEYIKDISRIELHGQETPLIQVSKSYLAARLRKHHIEQMSGSQVDTIPYRVIEAFRAKALVRSLHLEFETPAERDAKLPTVARELIDDEHSDRES